MSNEIIDQLKTGLRRLVWVKTRRFSYRRQHGRKNLES